MNQPEKTKAELLEELTTLRQRIEEIERAELQTARERLGSNLMDEEVLSDFLLTRDGIIIDLSEELAHRVGYQVDELIGQPVLPLVAPESRQTAMDSMNKSVVEPYRAFILHKDGSKIHLEAMARDIEIDDCQIRVIALRDISEYDTLVQALIKSEELFSVAFHTSPDSININRFSDGLYIEINQGFTEITGYTTEDVVGRTSLELNIWDDPADRERLVKGLTEHGVVTNLEAVFRMKDGQTRVGLMSARIIELGDVPHILSVTRDISLRKAAEEKIEDLNQELLTAYDETLAGWSQALNLRDPNTDTHSQRVVDLTLKLGRAVGIPDEELVHVRRGVLLHDIGKMGVPDNILLKPGPLTEQEWAIMHQHPTFAHQMLSAIPFLANAIDIPYCHHERWDGTGYPRRMQGDEIPLAARVFTVIDNYDALLSERTYRPAWDHDEVLAYIQEQAGKVFDPEIARIFLKMDV